MIMMAATEDLDRHPHRRRNALTGDWVLVSPHRAERPWGGHVEKKPSAPRAMYDPACYLCPGNERAGGHRNPAYTGTHVFDNDFPALLPDSVGRRGASDEMFAREPAAGACRVVCFSPRHDLTLAEMETKQVRSVIDTWAGQVREVRNRFRWVQVFENKGEIMGCSNPHPHGQIWAMDAIPNEPAKEDVRQVEYLRKHGSSLLLDYLRSEEERETRVVLRNEAWTILVPYWAVWPFETLVVPGKPVSHLDGLSSDDRLLLADALGRILRRYDNLFGISFPYSMGWHGAPGGGGSAEHWQLHAHFYPPLLRSADIRKFMVGFEMLGEPQRDFTAEEAAARLRDVSDERFPSL